MLVKYVRNAKGRRVGVVVATGKTNIGWSLCHRTDKWDKKKALIMAKGRSEKGTKDDTPHTVQYEYNCMIDRASRFYK